MSENTSTLPVVLTDDEMHALVDANLYGYDGEHNAHATPNYRYCKPGTPGYSFDFDEGLWHREGAG